MSILMCLYNMDVNRTRKMRRPNSNLPKIKPQVIVTIIG